MTSVHKVQPII